jgi:hypothetical protein
MKKLTVLLFSILISFSSYGEWTKIGESTDGNTQYMDKDTIKEHGGYIYWWELHNYLKPLSGGDLLSAISYKQVDCALNRTKDLSLSFYRKHMGEGTAAEYTPASVLGDDWTYARPGTVHKAMVDAGCIYTK